MTTILSSTQAEITALMDAAVKDPQHIPGLSVAFANQAGELIYQHCAGRTSIDSGNPVTETTMFCIASCTKIVGTIVAMQAVEKGLLSLDSADDVAKWAPELAHVPILKEITAANEVILVPKKNKITLRQLLTHTAGFGYSFFNPNLKKYTDLFGITELRVETRSINTPLTFEPGTDWQYGVGIDWALVVVSRAEGKSLNDLLQENVLKPAGVVDTTFRPDAETKARLMTLHQRGPDGVLRVRETPILEATLTDTDPALASRAFDSAGGGLLSRPTEYVKLLSLFLNAGVAPTTGARILSAASVDEMFTNQIPHWPDFARRPLTTSDPLSTNSRPEIFPQPGNPPQGWGLSWFLNTETAPSGRQPYSASWAGISNVFYWVDRTSGIVGMVATQIMPSADMTVLLLLGAIEKAVYKGLVKPGAEKI